MRPAALGRISALASRVTCNEDFGLNVVSDGSNFFSQADPCPPPFLQALQQCVPPLFFRSLLRKNTQPSLAQLITSYDIKLLA